MSEESHDWERRIINGHDLSLRETDWRCRSCGHWFDAASDANGWPCGEPCAGRHYGEPGFGTPEGSDA